MNHDYAHCWDYEQGVCPQGCFRAELTEDLKNWQYPVTFAKFKGTADCPLPNPKLKRTYADSLRAMTDEKLAEWMEWHDYCPDPLTNAPCIGPDGEPRAEYDCYQCCLDWLQREVKPDEIYSA